mgnify:CR=1 FL=1
MAPDVLPDMEPNTEGDEMNRKMMSAALAIVLVQALCSPLMAIDKSKVKEFTLDNGLRVITYEMHTSPVVYSLSLIHI